VLVGFGTHHGTVIAGDSWGAPLREMPVPLARHGSLEDVLHAAAPDQSLFMFPRTECPDLLTAELGHRAIGVVYLTGV
jgi:erythromycin esterase